MLTGRCRRHPTGQGAYTHAMWKDDPEGSALTSITLSVVSVVFIFVIARFTSLRIALPLAASGVLAFTGLLFSFRAKLQKRRGAIAAIVAATSALLFLGLLYLGAGIGGSL